MVQYFEGNYIHNNPVKKPIFNPQKNREVYIDFSNNNVNPVGSENNPFKTLGEAFDVVKNNYYESSYFIIRPGNYPFCSLYNAKRITIDVSDNNNVPVIDGLYIENSVLTLHNLKIKTTTKNHKNAAIQCYNSNIYSRYNYIVDEINSKYCFSLSRTKLNTSKLRYNDNEPSMFTNKCFTYITYLSELEESDISPLLDIGDDSCKIINPLRFENSFRYYYGDINVPAEFISMINSYSINNIQFELTVSASSNDKYIQNVKDTYKGERVFNLSWNFMGYEKIINTQIGLQISSDKIKLLDNYKMVNNSEFSNKQDNTAESQRLALTNIWIY